MRCVRVFSSAGLFCCLLTAAPPASAQSVRFLTVTPDAIPDGSTAPLLLEVEISGQPSRVALEFVPEGSVTTFLDLRDDGTGGDRVEGDATYTAEVPTPPILAARRLDDVNRVFIGFLNLYTGSTVVFRGNTFVDVHTADAGAAPVVRLGQFVQATTRLVNIHDPAYFLTNDPSRVTQEFYRWFGDDYDVINLIYSPRRFANRTHSIVQNRVQGIGRGITDSSAALGSAGRLLGISQFPIPTFFDGAETGHLHELGHQWINFLNVPPFASGVPHWPKSTMAAGVMGFSLGGQGGQGGSFPCDIVEQANGTFRLNARTAAPVYNDLDLYLMGLMPPGEVRTQIVFADQNAVAQLTCAGQIFSGQVTRVGADDVVRQFGPRAPAAGDAPTRFRLATILVTRDGLASPEMMGLYSWMVDRAELKTRVPTHAGFTKETAPPFFVATGGRGSLDMRLDFDEAPADFALVPTPGVQTVAAGASAEYAIAVEPRGAGFASPVTLACGPLPTGFSCAFSSPAAAPGEDAAVMLTLTTRPGVTAQAGAGRSNVSRSVALAAAGGLAIVVVSLPWPQSRARTMGRVAAAIVVVAVLGQACDGGGPRPPQNPQPPPAPGPAPSIPPVAFNVVVIGTAGAVQHSTVVTAAVQF